MKKYRSLTRCFIAIAVLWISLGLPAAANGSPHRDSDAKSPGAVVKNFYYWYINAV